MNYDLLKRILPLMKGYGKF